MKKADLIFALRDETRLHVDKVVAVLEALERLASQRIVSGETMLLPGIGLLEVRHRPARLGRNPRTGEALHVPPSGRVRFKPTKALRDVAKVGAQQKTPTSTADGGGRS